jgi:hypothetical protein
VCVVSLLATVLCAAPFEPLFVVKRFSGACEVRPPDAKSFAPAVPGKAYPYGTAVRTGKRAQLSIEFSPGGNECRLGPDTTVVVAEDAAAKQRKVLKLDVGKIEIEIEGAAQNGNMVAVETCCGVVESEGTKFTAESRREQDLAASIFAVDKGTLKAFGPHFTVPVMDGDDVLFVACAYDQSFTRIRNVRGQCSLEFTDSEGNPKTEEMVKDSVVKIWRKDSRDGSQTMITVLVAAPDGVTKETIQRTEAKPASSAVAATDSGSAETEAQPTPPPPPPPAPPGDSGKGGGEGAAAAGDSGKGGGEGEAVAGDSGKGGGEGEAAAGDSGKGGGEETEEPEVLPFMGPATFGASDTPIVTLPPPPGIPPEEPTPTQVGRR